MKKRRVAVTLFWALLTLGLIPAVFLQADSTFSALESERSSAPLRESSEIQTPLFEAKADRALQAAVAGAQPGEPLRFMVRLSDEATFEAIGTMSMEARRTNIVSQLQRTASSSQERLLKRLQVLQEAGHISLYRPYWIINGVAATGTAEAIRQISELPEVKEIRLDVQRRYFDPPAGGVNLETAFEVVSAPAAGLSWGVERVEADKVWGGLGIDGTGVTVAIVDTGVDWRHPDLIGNYRGNLGNGSVDHRGSWYSTISPTTITEPIDLFGHGTHVAGTAVGANGIGVAPGAQWIAVGIANEFGTIYESDIHEAFQWILAPDGDPGLAPDIVNNSWGGSATVIAFYDDVKALQAAGIITVFAAGNGGPLASTVDAPASYTDTLSVGASDDQDQVAWFSSRGPSPLTADLKPWLVAPGTRILSTLPQGQYGYYNGTSMAAPHVTGAIALLKSAKPLLSRPAILQILADSARAIGGSTPNSDSGWGRLDAYAAMAPQVQTGSLQGRVTAGGRPLAKVTITVTNASGMALHFETDAAGNYQAALRPGLYGAAMNFYGYVPQSVNGIRLIADQTTVVDFDLARLPGGVIQGTVRQANSSAPLTATIRIVGTPISVDTDNNGRYTVTVPQGNYQLRASAPGHRLDRASRSINDGQTVTQDFWLQPAPTILLIDSGSWYYQSYASFYESSLDGMDYAYDLRSIRDPVRQELTAAELQAYDFVIWSAPRDSPGSVRANDVITDYLGAGGNLLISGQNIGSNDGYGFDTQWWWHRDLEGQFLGKTYVTQTLTGSPGSIFEGLSLTLNGANSADNQTAIDQSLPQPSSLTRPALSHPEGSAAGLQAGACDPFRIVYLGFGLEGVSEYNDRVELLERSFAYFQSPRLETGVQWEPGEVDDFAPVGSQLAYSLTLRNLSETVTDTFRLEVSGSSWPVSLDTQSVTLGSCQIGQVVLTIDVPEGLPWESENTTRVRAASSNNGSIVADIELHHQVPGYMLLVDDDRWYNQETTFQAALDANGFAYDVWENGWDDNVRGSPTLEYLKAYDIVVWYTAYDWFAPVTSGENAVLTNYLAQGGRLFLTSQDFMYYHHDTPLARTYLGVVEYQESITPTQLFGSDNRLLPAGLAGPISLEYGPYQNFSDGLIPGPESGTFVWHDQGLPAGVFTGGANWRTVFWGLPFETLPLDNQAATMNSIVGWLGDLGDSTFDVDQRSGAAGAPRTYRIRLENLANGHSNKVSLTNTLPANLLMLPGTITGGAVYEAASHQLSWQGELASGANHVIRYRAFPRSNLPAGTRLDNRIRIHYSRHNLSFERTVPMWVESPDLSGSTFVATTTPPAPTQMVTYTLHLVNRGQRLAEVATADIRLPDQLGLISQTLQTSDGRLEAHEGGVLWQGELAPGQEVTVSLVMTREMSIAPLWLPATAVIHDGLTDTLIRDVRPYLRPYQTRLVGISKN